VEGARPAGVGGAVDLCRACRVRLVHVQDAGPPALGAVTCGLHWLLCSENLCDHQIELACTCTIWPPLPFPGSFPVQAEGQFIQLRTLIQSSLEQASGAALRRQQLLRQQAAVVGGLAEKGAEEGEGEEQAAPLPHTDPHIRGSEDMVPADADVASQHPHATSAAPVEPVQGKRGGGMGRRVRGEAGPSLPGGEPHLA
jgi:hypothetical protein